MFILQAIKLGSAGDGQPANSQLVITVITQSDARTVAVPPAAVSVSLELYSSCIIGSARHCSHYHRLFTLSVKTRVNEFYQNITTLSHSSILSNRYHCITYSPLVLLLLHTRVEQQVTQYKQTHYSDVWIHIVLNYCSFTLAFFGLSSQILLRVRTTFAIKKKQQANKKRTKLQFTFNLYSLTT